MRGEVLWDTHVKDDDGKTIFIKRSEIRNYVNEYFWDALHIHYMTETMDCLPFSGGWAEQPYEIATVIALFRIEQNRWDQETWEKDKNKK